MKGCFIIGLLITLHITLYSQSLQTIDYSSLKPISGVRVCTSNKSNCFVTNENGKLTLGQFNESDSISFYHVSYYQKRTPYKYLIDNNYKVFLHEKSYSLEEIVFSANKFEEKRKDIAQNIQVISSKEITNLNQQNTADLLQSTGNIFVQKSQLGGGSPVIRGFETNKVLLVVDGVRMNNAIYRGGHLQNVLTVDNTILEKTELIFGPGSVIYGSDALGGVMHFFTKNPKLSLDSTLFVSCNSFIRYSTANQEKTGHIDFNFGRKNLASLTSLTYSDFEDLRQGASRNPFYGNWGKREFYVQRINGRDSVIANPNSTIQKTSGYKQYDILQKFLFKQSEKITHVVNFQFSNSSNIPFYARLQQTVDSKPRFAEWYYGPQKRIFSSYTLNVLSATKMFNSFRIILAYQNIEESRNDRRLNSILLNSRTENLNIATVNFDLEKRILKHEIRYGIEASFNSVKSNATTTDIREGRTFKLNTRYPDGGSTYQSIAGYVSHSLELNKKLILNDGVRLSKVNLTSKFNDKTFFPFPFDNVSQNNSALNGNIGLVYMPTNSWRITSLVSSGFRAPNVDDLSKVFESVRGNIIVPNPNLKPEFTYNLDLGISKSINDNATIGINGFYTIYKNVITTSSSNFNGKDSIFYDGQLSKVTSNLNSNEAYIYGFNSFLSADISEFVSLYSCFNYTFARIKTDSINYPLDHIPPTFGKTSLVLKKQRFRGEFYAMYNGWKRLKDYNLKGEDNFAEATAYGMPAWFTLNLRTNFNIHKNLMLQMSLENILDKNYRTFASGISAP
ncbi:MAG: TonB-dependent receptor plug domain-containing protein, partial [Bacteroidia bacterium]